MNARFSPEFLARFALALVDHLVALAGLRLCGALAHVVLLACSAAALTLKLWPSRSGQRAAWCAALCWENLRLRACGRLRRQVTAGKKSGGAGGWTKFFCVLAAKLWRIRNVEMKQLFGASASTLLRWRRQADQGISALAPKSRRPHRSPNKTSESVTSLIWRCHDANPGWGRYRIAMTIWRHGCYVSFSTVYNVLNRPRPQPPTARKRRREKERTGRRPVESDAPNDLWLMDLTLIHPLGSLGRLLGLQPFHVLAVVDHFSRRCLCLRVHVGNPTAQWCVAQLAETMEKYGTPEIVTTDAGSQFTGSVFADFCGIHIEHRLAVEKHRSANSPVERFFHSLKHEALLYVVFLWQAQLQAWCDDYAEWYNGHRPHFALLGNVPNAVWTTGTPPQRIVRLTQKCELRNLKAKIFCGGLITAFESDADPPDLADAA